MISPLSLALSALNAFGQKLGAAPGTGKVETPAREGRNGSVAARSGRVEHPGGPGESPRENGPVLRAASTVSPEEGVPESTATVYGFRADLKTVKAHDAVRGHFLNTLA